MAESFVQLPADSTGKKLRTYDKGTPGHDQYVIPTTERLVSSRVFAATFRIAGLASANHNLCYIENSVGSTILIGVRRLVLEQDATAVLTSLAPSVTTHKVVTSLATGGTASTKHLFDSALASNASAVFRGAASAEGTASAITWSVPAGTAGWRQMLMRLHTAVGQVLHMEKDLIPEWCQYEPIILRAGQQLVSQVNIAYATTAHYVVKCAWEEFTLA